MVGILVLGNNHFIVRGPRPNRETALLLARHWSLIQIGQITPRPRRRRDRTSCNAIAGGAIWTRDRNPRLQPQQLVTEARRDWVSRGVLVGADSEIVSQSSPLWVLPIVLREEGDPLLLNEGRSWSAGWSPRPVRRRENLAGALRPRTLRASRTKVYNPLIESSTLAPLKSMARISIST